MFSGNFALLMGRLAGGMHVGLRSSKHEAQTCVGMMLKTLKVDQYSELWEQVLHCPGIESMAANNRFVI